jgi:hypothetical protein
MPLERPAADVVVGLELERVRRGVVDRTDRLVLCG